MLNQFDSMDRNGSEIFIHKSKTVWVVPCEATENRPETFQVYRAIEKAKKGAEAWTANNVRVGGFGQFKTVDDAMVAADAAAKGDIK